MERNNAQTADMRNALLGASFVFLAAVAFAAKAVLVKLAYRFDVDALTVLALRMVFSLPFFVAMAFWGEMKSETRISRRDMAAIFMLGLGGFYLSAYLDFVGLQYISAGLERLILFLYPTMVVLISAAFLGRKIGKGDMVALALSYLGVALAYFHDISSYGANATTGAILIFFCTLTYAAYLVGSGEIIKRAGPVRFTGYAMTVSCLAVIAHYATVHGTATVHLHANVYRIGLLMAVISTVFPVFMMSEGIRRIGASRAAIISSVGPVTTIFMAYLFLGEKISATQVAGTALIIAGVLSVGGSKVDSD